MTTPARRKPGMAILQRAITRRAAAEQEKAASLVALGAAAVRQAVLLLERANDKGVRLNEHVTTIKDDGYGMVVTFEVRVDLKAKR